MSDPTKEFDSEYNKKLRILKKHFLKSIEVSSSSILIKKSLVNPNDFKSTTLFSELTAKIVFIKDKYWIK